MKITDVFSKMFGTRLAYRLGRALYMESRGDVANDMATNGELMIQKGVVNAVKRSDTDALVCFDVGANVGDWSMALFSNCQSAQYQSFELYVFEPVPSTANALKNGLGSDRRVHYESFAMSSSVGMDVMYVEGELAGTNSLHRDHSDRPIVSIPVEKTTADAFCSLNAINTIHLLKSDTEGHDFEVILGALPLLGERRIAVLQFEYNHRWIYSRHYLKDVFDAIAGLPYRLGKVCPDHVAVYDKWYPEHERFFEANYVLLRDDCVAWFDCRSCRLDENCTLAVAPRSSGGSAATGVIRRHE